MGEDGGTRRLVTAARRVVVKVGSSSLVTADRELDGEQFATIAAQLAEARRAGRRVILVSSGAVTAGRGLLGLTQPPRTIPLKQACAATGQRALMERWETAFQQHGLRTAQVLLTRDDVSNRTRFVNARNTFETLLRFDVVPVVNENDTVAVDEIKFGDNDHLSALVANLVHAELLVLLTDTDGLYTADPNRATLAGAEIARRIPFVDRVNDDILALAGQPSSDVGLGGMRSKVKTAAMASAYGATTVVAHGREPEVLARVFRGDDVGTCFAAHEDPMSARKHWIAFSAEVRGALVLDAGAVRAVREGGRSLLPSGVLAVSGDFGPGDLVRCLDGAGREIARGLTNYGVGVFARICGRRSEDIRRMLGEDACDEAIHRDDLVLMDGREGRTT